jgi:hypothetical protein
MTTVAVHDNHFDSFAGAGECSVITAATPAANPHVHSSAMRPTAENSAGPTVGFTGQTPSAAALANRALL